MSKITFNTKDLAFFAALRANVDAYFKDNNLKTTGNSTLYVKAIILLTSMAGLYTWLVFFTPPVWISIILCVILGLNIAAVGFNVMHDGAHSSFSSKERVNTIMGYSLNLFGGSVFLWKAKHNIIHHSFTNIHGMDDDIDIEPWIRTHTEQKRYWHHRFQHIYWVLLYGTTYALWIYIQDFTKYFSGKVGDTPYRKMNVKEHFIFWITKVLYIGVYVIVPVFMVGLVPTIIGYSIVCFVCGFILSVVFQLAHVVTQTEFPMPSTDSNQMENDWAVHQIATTANFATKNKVVSWFTGGLNYQVEHHLFPRISHVHYPKINELVKETCAKFNVRYIEFPTMLSALGSHIAYLKIIGTSN
jgi:linoleoyl-CoA desaturase